MSDNNDPSESATHIPALTKLSALYSDMDILYNKTADEYGFNCAGCEENCCLTRFYHHTLVEYQALKQAFLQLSPNTQDRLIKKAEAVEEMADRIPEGEPVRIMCPLNHDGKCILYHARPMICRLHGIPHELSSPAAGKKIHPGCSQFDLECGHGNYIPFDRTSIYMKLAALEKEARNKAHVTKHTKRTVSQMLIDFQSDSKSSSSKINQGKN